ncbi:hypothetical protein ES703_89557 [subsurface metagenome]
MAYCSVKADCPATGQEGELIEARVTVTNLHIYNWIFLTEIWAGAELIAEADDLIPPGTSKTYYGYFTMPGYNVTVLGWVDRVSSFEPWETVFCGADSATVVYAPPAPPDGTITRKELDYQDIWQALPLYNIPVGTRTRVRIWGRNDTSINQKMGIYWFVADPEGYVVQEHYDWETFWTGPGLEQGFVGSGFDLTKVGKYTIWMELLMNPDDPQVVDRYTGDLCTVAAVVPEPEFRNFALSEYTR